MKDGYKIRTLDRIIIKFYIPSNLQQLLSFKSSPKLVAKHVLLILLGGCGFSVTEVLFIFWAFFSTAAVSAISRWRSSFLITFLYSSSSKQWYVSGRSTSLSKRKLCSRTQVSTILLTKSRSLNGLLISKTLHFPFS